MSAIILTVITILGAVLTLAGITVGARRLVQEHRYLVRKLDEVTAVGMGESLTPQEITDRRTAILPPTSTWGDIEYFREWVRRFILEQAVTNLGLPAVLTGCGVILSTVASAWGVWA
jgi:hypothetical protein